MLQSFPKIFLEDRWIDSTAGTNSVGNKAAMGRSMPRQGAMGQTNTCDTPVDVWFVIELFPSFPLLPPHNWYISYIMWISLATLVSYSPLTISELGTSPWPFVTPVAGVQAHPGAAGGFRCKGHPPVGCLEWEGSCLGGQDISRKITWEYDEYVWTSRVLSYSILRMITHTYIYME